MTDVDGLVEFLEGVVEMNENPRKWTRLALESAAQKGGNVALPPKREKDGNRK